MTRQTRHWQILSLMLLGFVFLFGGTAAATQAVPKDKVEDWMFHDTVDYDFVKDHIVIPRDESVYIIDSRPYQTKYVKGYIPTAYSIPESQFEEMQDKLPKDKNTLLIFYCGGYDCKLSHKSAKAAEAMGYKNVKVYAAGFPDFKKHHPYYAVEMEYVKDQLAEGAPYMLIDSRPHNKFLEGNVPSSIGISDTKFDEKKGLLPSDKDLQLIFYCGGHHCKLSHKSAMKARELGYTDVVVAEEGYPAWKKKFGASGAVAIDAGGNDGTFDVDKFQALLKDSPDAIQIIDVRDEDEFKKGHFPGAMHMTVDQLEKNMDTLPGGKPIVFVCSTGARSGEAYYMVLDKQPDRKDVYFLDAQCTFDGENYEIKKHE